MEFKQQTWYWMSNPDESDLFYPVFIVDNDQAMIDGERLSIGLLAGLLFTEMANPTPDQFEVFNPTN